MSVTGGWRVQDVREVDDGVVTTVVGNGERREVRSRYVIGADGGSSTVRRLAGSRTVGGVRDREALPPRRAHAARCGRTGPQRGQHRVQPARLGVPGRHQQHRLAGVLGAVRAGRRADAGRAARHGTGRVRDPGPRPGAAVGDVVLPRDADRGHLPSRAGSCSPATPRTSARRAATSARASATSSTSAGSSPRSCAGTPVTRCSTPTTASGGRTTGGSRSTRSRARRRPRRRSRRSAGSGCPTTRTRAPRPSRRAR